MWWGLSRCDKPCRAERRNLCHEMSLGHSFRRWYAAGLSQRDNHYHKSKSLRAVGAEAS